MVTSQELDQAEAENRAILSQAIPVRRFNEGYDVRARQQFILQQREQAQRNLDNINQIRDELREQERIEALNREQQRLVDIENEARRQANRKLQGKPISFDNDEEREAYRRLLRENPSISRAIGQVNEQDRELKERLREESIIREMTRQGYTPPRPPQEYIDQTKIKALTRIPYVPAVPPPIEVSIISKGLTTLGVTTNKSNLFYVPNTREIAFNVGKKALSPDIKEFAEFTQPARTKFAEITQPTADFTENSIRNVQGFFDPELKQRREFDKTIIENREKAFKSYEKKLATYNALENPTQEQFRNLQREQNNLLEQEERFESTINQYGTASLTTSLAKPERIPFEFVSAAVTSPFESALLVRKLITNPTATIKESGKGLFKESIRDPFGLGAKTSGVIATSSLIKAGYLRLTEPIIISKVIAKPRGTILFEQLTPTITDAGLITKGDFILKTEVGTSYAITSSRLKEGLRDIGFDGLISRRTQIVLSKPQARFTITNPAVPEINFPSSIIIRDGVIQSGFLITKRAGKGVTLKRFSTIRGTSGEIDLRAFSSLEPVEKFVVRKGLGVSLDNKNFFVPFKQNTNFFRQSFELNNLFRVSKYSIENFGYGKRINRFVGISAVKEIEKPSLNFGGKTKDLKVSIEGYDDILVSNTAVKDITFSLTPRGNVFNIKGFTYIREPKILTSNLEANIISKPLGKIELGELKELKQKALLKSDVATFRAAQIISTAGSVKQIKASQSSSIARTISKFNKPLNTNELPLIVGGAGLGVSNFRGGSALFEDTYQPLALNVIQRPIENITQIPVERTIERAIQRPLLRPIERVIQTPIQSPIQRPIERVIQRPIQRVIQRPVERTIQRPIARVPIRAIQKTKPFPILKSGVKKPLVSSKTANGFRTFTITKGKKVFLSGVRSRGEALRVGEVKALKTLRATFGIEESKFKVNLKPSKFKVSTKAFRSFKISKGQKIPLKNIYIQRTRKEGGLLGGRLQSFGERNSIQEARRLLIG